MIPAHTPLWSTRPRRVSPEGRAKWGPLSKARRCSREYRIPTSHRSPKRGEARALTSHPPRTRKPRDSGGRGGLDRWGARLPSILGREVHPWNPAPRAWTSALDWLAAGPPQSAAPSPPRVPGSVPCNVSSISRPSCQNSHLHNGHPAYLPMLTYSCERAKEALHSLSVALAKSPA